MGDTTTTAIHDTAPQDQLRRALGPTHPRPRLPGSPLLPGMFLGVLLTMSDVMGPESLSRPLLQRRGFQKPIAPRALRAQFPPPAQSKPGDDSKAEDGRKNQQRFTRHS
ncbi:MAG: hypothetical protein CSA62_01310 [Planctomycetota bacterium]|nr:MAG: hypothetical protein CSA62_01310 [Planctomycetota bacterium]